MKVPVDDLSILLGLDGLAMVEHEGAALVEELMKIGTAEAIFHALEIERREKELKLHRLLN